MNIPRIIQKDIMEGSPCVLQIVVCCQTGSLTFVVSADFRGVSAPKRAGIKLPAETGPRNSCRFSHLLSRSSFGTPLTSHPASHVPPSINTSWVPQILLTASRMPPLGQRALLESQCVQPRQSPCFRCPHPGVAPLPAGVGVVLTSCFQAVPWAQGLSAQAS